MCSPQAVMGNMEPIAAIGGLLMQPSFMPGGIILMKRLNMLRSESET